MRRSQRDSRIKIASRTKHLTEMHFSFHPVTITADADTDAVDTDTDNHMSVSFLLI